MSKAKIYAAANCLTDAQIHLDEILLQSIIDATDHTDALNVIHLTGYIQRTQRNISATMKDIYNLPV